MSRARIPFLPTFLTILSIAFAVVLVARIRSYGGASGGRNDGGDVASASDGPSAKARRSSSSSSSSSPDDLAADDGSAQTSTIVTLDSKGNPQGLSARERQYRELLNAPPPKGTSSATPQQQAPVHVVSAAKPPERPQSTLQKIMQPIKNLFGGGSGPPMQQPPSTRPNPDTPKPVDKDPTTDTTPPQVTAVQFDPARVNDGESAAVIVTAMDDMSGIRGISGTVTSPTGKALQGFACQREAPESNRYVGRVNIPKDAEEGMWHINFLNVSDQASNSVTLAFAQSPVLQAALLQVTSSRSDKTPPTVKAAWIDHRSMRAGERNTLFVQAQDDKSGVNLVSAVFISPKRLARIGVACQGGDSDLWTCGFTVPACLDCGDWSLDQIQLQDKASNMIAIGAKLDACPTCPELIVASVRVNIAGDSCDDAAPVVQSVVLDTNSVPTSPKGTSVGVHVSATDDGCGIATVSGQVLGPTGGNGIFFVFAPAGDGTYVGQMPIPPLAGKGVWKLNWLQVMDKGNNLRILYWSDPLLQNVRVTVH
jgi:hypothetical protein